MGRGTVVTPRFSRGQEVRDHGSEEQIRPDFARGQRVAEVARVPMGTFALGQARRPQHPELDYPGRFSRGQERSV